MRGRSRYFLPPAVAAPRNNNYFQRLFFYTAAHNLGIGGSGERGKAELMECLEMPAVRCRDLFCAMSGRYLLITRKCFRIDNVDIVA